MHLEDAMRQKSRQLELPFGPRGEASRAKGSGEAPPAVHRNERSGTDDTKLMERVVANANVAVALKRVEQNRGSPGIDGMSVGALRAHLRATWRELREQLLSGTYEPQPVKRQTIPKSDGGVRELGIPTALDRFIQQAVLQVLQPQFDPTFSPHSHGFRPGRSAHDAVCEAQRYIREGHTWVVVGRDRGTPQGGPLSPLLANVLLDEVDKELEARGHRFTRYADDCNVYVRSRRAGERVMQALQRLYERLRLRINESKSAVARPWERSFLGYSFWVPAEGPIRRKIASKSLAAMKARVRVITRRRRGRSMKTVIEELRTYLPGWKNYFRLTEMPEVFSGLDGWIRRRLRALQLKHWKNRDTIYRELRLLGLSETAARKVAGNARRWWKASAKQINIAMPVAYFDELGLPKLAAA